MFEMKLSLMALVIVLILLGTGVYYTGNQSERDAVRNSLRAALPDQVAVTEVPSLPVVTESAAPEGQLNEAENEVTSTDVLAADPQVEGIITEEAAIDVNTTNDGQAETDDIVAVPLTAQTGAQISTWIVIGASLLTGGLGLLIAPTVAVRG